MVREGDGSVEQNEEENNIIITFNQIHIRTIL